MSSSTHQQFICSSSCLRHTPKCRFSNREGLAAVAALGRESGNLGSTHVATMMRVFATVVVSSIAVFGAVTAEGYASDDDGLSTASTRSIPSRGDSVSPASRSKTLSQGAQGQAKESDDNSAPKQAVHMSGWGTSLRLAQKSDTGRHSLCAACAKTESLDFVAELKRQLSLAEEQTRDSDNVASEDGRVCRDEGVREVSAPVGETREEDLSDDLGDRARDDADCEDDTAKSQRLLVDVYVHEITETKRDLRRVQAELEEARLFEQLALAELTERDEQIVQLELAVAAAVRRPSRLLQLPNFDSIIRLTNELVCTWARRHARSLRVWSLRLFEQFRIQPLQIAWPGLHGRRKAFLRTTVEYPASVMKLD